MSTLICPWLTSVPVIVRAPPRTVGHLDGAVGGVGERAAARRQGVGIAGVLRLQEDGAVVGQAGGHRQRRVLLEVAVALHPERRVGQVVRRQRVAGPSSRMVVGGVGLAVT